MPILLCFIELLSSCVYRSNVSLIPVINYLLGDSSRLE
jgi:hypothetical protein